MPSIQDYLKQYEAESTIGSPGSAGVADFSRVSVPDSIAKPQPKSGKMTDLLVTGAKGVIGVGEAAVGLANLPTFGYAGKALESVGYRPDEAKSALDELYSPYRQELNRGLAETKGFVPTAKYMLQNPSTIGHAIVESIPATAGGGAIAQAVKKIAPALGVATRAGIGEGMVGAGAAAESIRQRTEDGALSPGQVGASVLSGVGTGLLGAAGGKLATKMGLPDVDVALAGGPAGALKPGYLKRVGTAALVEGVFEELPQSAQEQVWQNLALGKPFSEGVAEAAAQGMLAGMGMGGGFAATKIRGTTPNNVTNDDLKGGIDEQLAPPAVPAAPLQAEFEQAQREFEIANRPRNDRYPALAEATDAELQRMDALLGSERGKGIAEADSLRGAIAEELQLRARATEPTLAQRNDAVIARQFGRPEFDLEPSPVGDVAPAAEPEQIGIPPATDLTRTAPLFDTEGRVSPEAAIAERAARAGTPDMSADEVAARLQAATTPAPGGQAALMAGQLPTPSPIVTATGGGAPIPAASLKGLPSTAKAELSKHLGNPEQLAAAVADMFYTKASAGSSAAYVFDKLPALYQQLTGQPLPETPAQVAAPLQRSALPFELQGETPAQAAENFARRQELEALAQPLPVVQIPRGKQQSTFLDRQGEVDLIQPGMSRRESVAQRRAREFAEQNKAARQKLVADTLGTNIPEVAPDAVQEPVTAKVDVRQPAKAGKQVARGDTQKAAAAKGQAAGQAAQGEIDVATPAVVEQRREGASDNAPAGTGAGSDRAVSPTGRVRGRAGAPATSGARPVVVGDTAGESSTRVGATAGYSFKDMRNAYESSSSGPAGRAARLVELTGIAELEQIGITKQQREQAKKYLDSAAVDPKEAATARRQAEDAVGRVSAQENRQVERDKAAAARQKALDKQLKGMTGTSMQQLDQRIANARNKDAEAKAKAREKRNIPPAASESWDRMMAEMDELADKTLKGQASGTETAPVNPNVHTLRSLAEVLVERFGESMRSAILAGRVKLVVNQTHLAAETGDMSRRGKLTMGMYYYNPSKPAGSGTVYFVAGNLARTQQGYTAIDVALHEIGEHAGMEQMLGKQNYQQLLGTVRKAMAVKEPKTAFEKDVAAAKQKLLVDQQGQANEVLAYMIQHTPESTGLQKMWAAIKAFAARFGLLPGSMLDAATMRALAEGATAQWLKGVAGQAAARGAVGQDSGQDRWGMTRAALQQVENGRLTLDGEYGFDTMTRLLDEARALQADYPDSTVVELYKDLGGTGVVYGAGGYNRYGLRADGQLATIESSFANKEKLQQARAALSRAQNVTGAASGINNPEMRTVLTNYSEAATAAKQLLHSVEGMKPVDWQGTQLGAFKLLSSWITKHHMVAQFDKWFKGALAKNAEADTIQQATSARVAQLFNEPYNRLKALPQDIQEKVGKLMELTEMKLDPRKTWDAHTHLRGLTGTALSQAKDYHNKGRQWWGQLGATAQGKVAQGVYTDLAAMNETLYTMELAASTYNMVHANAGPAKDLAVFKSDPTARFRQTAAVHGSIEAAYTYWKGVLDSYNEALTTYTAEQRGLLPAKSVIDPEVAAAERKMLKGVQNEKVRRTIRAQLRTRTDALSDEQKKILKHLSPLEAQLRVSTETVETFKHAPYFHLGRFGDQFVSFRVRADEAGTADPKAMQHVQQVLATEFPDVAIRTDATDPHVFARFESIDQAAAFVERAQQLQKEGWLMQKGVKDKGNTDLGEIRHGKRSEIIAGYHTAGPNWLSRVVESIQAEGFDDVVTRQMVASVRSMYLDSLPDTAAIKVKQRREGVPGWHRDMMRNYAHRMRVGANRVASLAAEPTRTQSFAEMNDVLKQSETDPSISALQRNKMAVLVEELQKRNSNQMSVPHTPGVDMLRALNHAYFLGMSPSYLLIQMTQLGVLAWPELSKKYGFVKSAKALSEVSGIAFKVVGAVLREGYKSRGVAGAADMVITGDILESAGVSASDAEFLIKIMAAGKLDIGNAARNVGRVAEGETGSEALKIATSMGYASEVLTRTITALAAKRLHKGKDDVVKYAIDVIDESMLDYTIENEGRMMSKQGVIGAASPVMFSFMKYQAQLLEKLYRETYNAYSKTATTEQKAEARKFLGGHLAVMMLLAGSLGLPFATVVAAAADKLCEMFGDGYCDSKTAMRNMTAEVFGHDIEPLLSKGFLSRALGFDISERAGEGNILPFSKFLADKRTMDERLQSMAADAWGAPTAMVTNILKANEKMWQGDLMGAMQEGLPMALKGPVKAYELSEKGYVDKSGNVLPMTAGAYDMLLQSVGLNPGEKADYQQAKFAQSQRTGVLGREATQIRTKLASAIERNDADAMQKWLEKARAYDAENAGSRAILPHMGSVLQQRARARALAESSNTTLGVSPKDIGAQQFTSFYRTE